MNLLEVRKQFREISGRYDLVNNDGSNNGADFYINEASKWLDKMVETSKSGASFMAVVNAGDWYVKFPYARAVKEIWISTANGRYQLTKLIMQDMIASFFRGNPSTWVNGVPKYYSPTITRYIPEDVSPANLAIFATYVGLIASDTSNYNAVILSSPVTENTLVEVIGYFYSKILAEDDDENYWSTVNPMLLIQATARQVSIITGNKPMTDSMDRGINSELSNLEKDLVEQGISEIDQMEG